MRTRSRDTTASVACYQQTSVRKIPGSPQGSGRFAWWSGIDDEVWSIIATYSPDVSSPDSSKLGVIETITDNVDSPGSYNEVSHTKEVWDFPLVPFIMEGREDYNGITVEGLTTGQRSAIWSLVEGDNPLPGSFTLLENAISIATGRMQFGIQDAQLNIPTFVGELRDFRTIFKGIFRKRTKKDLANVLFPEKGIEKVLLSMERYVRKVLRGKNNPIKDLLTLAISADLTNKFAIQPLRKDLKAIGQLSRHLEAQYSRMMNAAKRPITVHGTVVEVGPADSDEAVGTPYQDMSRSQRTTRTVHTWALVKYDLGNMPAMPDVVRDMIGFDDIHKAVWENIPLSFIVDYVFKVEEWLNQFGGQAIELPYTILDQGYSVKTETLHTVTTHYSSGGLGPTLYNHKDDGSRHVVGTCTRSQYNRYKLPLPFLGTAYPRLTLPSFNQGVTAFEVWYTMIKR